MSMESNQVEHLTKLLSQSTRQEKEYLLAELAREFLDGGSHCQPVVIRDSAGTIVAYLQPTSVPLMPSEQDSPEFAAELRRRRDCEPVMTSEAFISSLRAAGGLSEC